MSKVLVNDSSLISIGSAIRSKNGSNTGYKPSEMAAAINALDMGIVPTGTVNISQNGTMNVTQYASAVVNVPNSYSASDEGKVVSNGALAEQTARASEITQNGVYDTTENNSVVVNVSGEGGSADDPFALTDYIESSGTQWIDTGYFPNEQTRIECVTNLVKRQSSGEYMELFGAENGRTNYIGLFTEHMGTPCIGGYFYYDTILYTEQYYTNLQRNMRPLVDVFLDHKICININKNRVEVTDGNYELRVPTIATLSGNIPYSLWLFDTNASGVHNSAISYCRAKLYRFRIYEDDTLVHEFIPWTDSNDVVCLKDTVTGNLKYNQGTGVFVRGTDS